MPYIDKDYYENNYEGIPVNGDAFKRLTKRASEIIDFLTNHALKDPTLDLMGIPIIEEQVKKATAAQVEYLHTQGESKAMGAGSLGQVSAGNFSYGERVGDDTLSRQQQMTSSAVLEHLKPTGLLYQGVGVYD